MNRERVVMNERYELAVGRLAELADETIVPEPFRDFFVRTADFLMTALRGEEADNRDLYEDILPDNYGASYGNPAYAVEKLGDYGFCLSAVYAELRGIIPCVFEGDDEGTVVLLELFLQLYGAFSDEALPTPHAVREIFRSYVCDYLADHVEARIAASLDPKLSFAAAIIDGADLSDTAYLCRFGEYVSENAIRTAEYLAALPESVIDEAAAVMTEGYRTGFIKAGKPLEKKKTVSLRFELGFERLIRAVMRRFRAMGLEPVLTRAAFRLNDRKQALRIGYYGAGPNRQFDYDHRNDLTLVLDKDYVSARLRDARSAYEARKEAAAVFGGPACLDTFGEVPFEPVNKPEVPELTERQQKLYTELTGGMAEITNRYIRGEERSFTIMALPMPSIGADFPAIFRETMVLNALPSADYETIQQTLIEALDRGQTVRVTGRGANKTDLTIALHKLDDPRRQTNFENCTADVNIPVGEVFTSPVLKGTNGTLHVTQVYLEGLYFRDLTLRIEDGMITDYGCANYDSREAGRAFIKDNILYRHETLPMGEFAIGTNTPAYAMARRFGIEACLPILIAEKTGPHFAFGDTCYSHEEAVPVFNADGREVIARENERSALREKDPGAAYFNCHTDITIPYDELGAIEVVSDDGSRITLIRDGRFVLPGTEALNRPLSD